MSFYIRYKRLYPKELEYYHSQIYTDIKNRKTIQNIEYREKVNPDSKSSPCLQTLACTIASSIVATST